MKDSDTEDINDNNQTILSYDRWCLSTVLLKEGWISKKGEIRRFKLFANKQMVYFADNGSNIILKGHINLDKVTDIVKKTGNALELSTPYRFWVLEFITPQDRDIWYELINGVVITEAVNDINNYHID